MKYVPEPGRRGGRATWSSPRASTDLSQGADGRPGQLGSGGRRASSRRSYVTPVRTASSGRGGAGVRRRRPEPLDDHRDASSEGLLDARGHPGRAPAADGAQPGLPGQARVLDPFLLVMVYCGLTRGETHGMLAGAAAGWVQDVHFGGRVLGLSGLTKMIVGFAVGLAAHALPAGRSRGPQLLVLFAATRGRRLDLRSALAAVFDVAADELSAVAASPCAGAVNAVVRRASSSALVDRAAAAGRPAREDLRGSARRADAAHRHPVRCVFGYGRPARRVLLAPPGAARQLLPRPGGEQPHARRCRSPRRAGRSRPQRADPRREPALLQRGARPRARGRPRRQRSSGSAGCCSIGRGGDPRAHGAAGAALPPGGGEGRRRDRGRGRDRGAAAGAAARRASRSCRCAPTRCAGAAAHVLGPRGRGHRAPARAGRPSRARSRATWWARPGVEAQYNRALMGKDGVRRSS